MLLSVRNMRELDKEIYEVPLGRSFASELHQPHLVSKESVIHKNPSIKLTCDLLVLGYSYEQEEMVKIISIYHKYPIFQGQDTLTAANSRNKMQNNDKH